MIKGPRWCHVVPVDVVQTLTRAAARRAQQITIPRTMSARRPRRLTQRHSHKQQTVLETDVVCTDFDLFSSVCLNNEGPLSFFIKPLYRPPAWHPVLVSFICHSQESIEVLYVTANLYHFLPTCGQTLAIIMQFTKPIWLFNCPAWTQHVHCL